MRNNFQSKPGDVQFRQSLFPMKNWNEEDFIWNVRSFAKQPTPVFRETL